MSKGCGHEGRGPGVLRRKDVSKLIQASQRASSLTAPCSSSARKRRKAWVGRYLLTLSSWNVRCPWKSLSGVGLSNATFSRQKLAHASLGRALQRSRGHLKKQGAWAVTSVVRRRYAPWKSMSAQPDQQRGEVLLGGCADGDRTHSHPEFWLRTASWWWRWGRQAGEDLWRTGRQWGGGLRESSSPTSLSRLSLDFSFHPPFNPAGFVPIESNPCNSTFRDFPWLWYSGKKFSVLYSCYLGAPLALASPSVKYLLFLK